MITNRRAWSAVVVAVLGTALLTACGSGGDEPAAPGGSVPTVTVRHPPGVTPPPAGARFDYQLGGAYPPAGAVRIVDRDRSAPPAPGRYGICYVNAFQTQPAETAWWQRQHPGLLLRHGGDLVEDPDWPGEVVLDVSTAANRQALAAVVDGWIDGCRRSGYQAVEPDNLDSWTRSDGALDRDDAIAFARLLAARAHADGLAIAQKNTPQLGTSGRDAVGFDFAVAEECGRYDECDAYTSVYGREVIEIEYTDAPKSIFTRACAERGAEISVVLRDRDVVPTGDPAYRAEAC